MEEKTFTPGQELDQNYKDTTHLDRLDWKRCPVCNELANKRIYSYMGTSEQKLVATCGNGHLWQSWRKHPSGG